MKKTKLLIVLIVITILTVTNIDSVKAYAFRSCAKNLSSCSSTTKTNSAIESVGWIQFVTGGGISPAAGGPVRYYGYDGYGGSLFCTESGVKFTNTRKYDAGTKYERWGKVCGIVNAMTGADTTYGWITQSNLDNWTSDSGSYSQIQKAIWRYQYYTGGCGDVYLYSTPAYGSITTGGNGTMYDAGSYYIATISVGKSGVGSYSAWLEGTYPYGTFITDNYYGTYGKSSFNSSTSTLYIKVPSSNVSSTYSFSIALSGDYHSGTNYYLVPYVQEYRDSRGAQPLGTVGYSTYYTYSYSKVTTSKRISVTNPKGNVTFHKTDGSGKALSNVTFTLSNGQSCTTGPNGTCPIYNVKYGTYTLTEYNRNTGYRRDRLICTSGCTNISDTSARVIIGSKYSDVYIKNKTACALDFEALSNKNDPIARIELYKKYSTSSLNPTNLLNFSNTYSSNSELACQQNTSCKTNSVQAGCMSAKSDNSLIDYNNLSCYTDTVNYNNQTGYCGYSYNLTNNLNGGLTFTNSFNFNTVKSGLLPLKRDELSKNIATGYLVKKCYFYYDNKAAVSNSYYMESNDYSNYINEVKFNDKVLPYTSNHTVGSSYATYGGRYYNESVNIYTSNYSLNPVYAKRGSGEIMDSLCDSCVLVGYGFASNFYNKTTTNLVVPFSFRVSTKLDKKLEISSNTCTYSVDNEIVDDIDPKNLNIEFRVIDTSHPFPGKSGSSKRLVGSNWCENSNCNSDNEIVTDEIIDSNNSYNKKRLTPKYTINLTRENIEKIRNYNKQEGNEYSNYSEDCKDGKCNNHFLQVFSDLIK